MRTGAEVEVGPEGGGRARGGHGREVGRRKEEAEMHPGQRKRAREEDKRDEREAAIQGGGARGLGFRSPPVRCVRVCLCGVVCVSVFCVRAWVEWWRDLGAKMRKEGRVAARMQGWECKT